MPEYDENLESVKIVDRDGPRVVSEWVGIVREFAQKIKWTEEDVWDDDSHACTFTQVKGDFDAYDGTWVFVAEGDDVTRIDLELQYEYNVPLIGKLIQGLLHKKTQQSAEGIMNAIKQMAENA